MTSPFIEPAGGYSNEGRIICGNILLRPDMMRYHDVRTQFVRAQPEGTMGEETLRFTPISEIDLLVNLYPYEVFGEEDFEAGEYVVKIINPPIFVCIASGSLLLGISLPALGRALITGLGNCLFSVAISPKLTTPLKPREGLNGPPVNCTQFRTLSGSALKSEIVGVFGEKNQSYLRKGLHYRRSTR